jgi:8-oxo-dGTP diphosphatase
MSEPIKADPQLARQGPADRPVVQVAVGVLVRHAGEGRQAFLMTSRPEGKVYAGYWEFPGGKLEQGESVQAALVRELEEELGIHATEVQLWRTLQVDYPHALVNLNFCKVPAWTGELTMREGQHFAWQQLPADVEPILPGALPVLEWLQDEPVFLKD